MHKREIKRYNRQMILTGVGHKGQINLKNASVLVIGAGGLGCPVLQYLTGAGIGKIGIIDGDVISLSNLQRQILYTEDEIGLYKAEVAAEKMKRLNSNIEFSVFIDFLTENNAEGLISTHGIVIGATDNFESRYLIDKYSAKHRKPFVHGAIYNFEGRISVFNYKGSPSYSDVFPHLSNKKEEVLGVIGALPGIVGSYMALEVIKIVTQTGKVSCDGLYTINGLNNSFTKLGY